MKKYFLSLIILLTLFSTSVYAGAATGAIQPPTEGSITVLFNKLTSIIRPVILISFVAMMIYGGYTRMTAAGSPDKEEKSVKILTGAIIGFIIVALAPAVVSIVKQLINIPI